MILLSVPTDGQGIRLNFRPSGRQRAGSQTVNVYHEGNHWTDRIMEGIRSVFDREREVELLVTCMDTKRISAPERFSKLRDLCARK